jgi:hypothetical protein
LSDVIFFVEKITYAVKSATIKTSDLKTKFFPVINGKRSDSEINIGTKKIVPSATRATILPTNEEFIECGKYIK